MTRYTKKSGYRNIEATKDSGVDNGMQIEWLITRGQFSWGGAGRAEVSARSGEVRGEEEWDIEERGIEELERGEEEEATVEVGGGCDLGDGWGVEEGRVGEPTSVGARGDAGQELQELPTGAPAV
jgi:hypothetical protein